MKKNALIAVAACVMTLGSAALLPSAAYAQDANAGNGAGDCGGHAGGNANGHATGMSGEHRGKTIRDHGDSGNRYGSLRNDDNGHGSLTSAIGHSKDTRGLSKATGISTTTPGAHNTKGLGNATSSTKNDR